MNIIKTACIGVIASFSAASAMAQTAMSHDDMMKGMSKHDMMMMKHCQSMDHAMMMKSKSCKKMMKMHPDMMHDDGMMKH